MAQTARGPELRRMVSASDRQSRAALQPSRHGRQQAAGGIVRHGLGLALTMRRRPGARQTVGHPLRIRKGGPPQARFHPHPGCRPALAGHKGQGFLRWLAWPILPFGLPHGCVPPGRPFRLILLPAEPAGAPPPPFAAARYGRSGRPSPRPARRVHRTIRQREWGECGTACGDGDERPDTPAQVIEVAGPAARNHPRLSSDTVGGSGSSISSEPRGSGVRGSRTGWSMRRFQMGGERASISTNKKAGKMP